MQRVPVARPVPEQQRCGAGLTGPVTLLEPVIEVVRPRRRPPEPSGPFPGDHHQMWPEGRAKRHDQLRQRPIEVSVLALAEPVASHVDGRAEPAVVAVEAREHAALRRTQHRARERAPNLVEHAGDRWPVQLVDATCHWRHGVPQRPVSRTVRLSRPGGRPSPPGAVPSRTLGTPW